VFIEAYFITLDLVSTLLSISSVSLNISALSTSIVQVDAYISRFRPRLSHKHLLYLERLRVTLEALFKYISEWKDRHQRERGHKSESSDVVTVGELVLKMGRGTEGINLLEINQYLKTSKVSIYFHYAGSHQIRHQDC
jgi:chromosome transmission fidelity protein 1